MRILKKTFVVGIVLAMTLSFAFANGATEAPVATNAKTELVWAVWDINSTAYYKPIIDAYQAKTPNVTIRMVDLGSADFMGHLWAGPRLQIHQGFQVAFPVRRCRPLLPVPSPRRYDSVLGSHACGETDR